MACVPTRAQFPDSTVFLKSNTPVILRLAGNGQPVEAVFAGEAGQVVTIVAQAADSAALDLVLEWVSPTGERVAYNDDWAGDRTDIPAPDGFEALATSDSALIRLVIATTGAYTARLNSFNGEGVGDFNLTISVESTRALMLGESLRVGLHRAEIASFALDMSAGQTVTLTASDPRGVLDAVLTLVNTDGAVIAENDDHGSSDLTLTIFDSRLTFTATDAGTYTVQARDFLGRAGTLVISADDEG